MTIQPAPLEPLSHPEGALKRSMMRMNGRRPAGAQALGIECY